MVLSTDFFPYAARLHFEFLAWPCLSLHVMYFCHLIITFTSLLGITYSLHGHYALSRLASTLGGPLASGIPLHGYCTFWLSFVALYPGFFLIGRTHLAWSSVFVRLLLQSFRHPRVWRLSSFERAFLNM